MDMIGQARDETSYPSTNLLSILYYIVGPPWAKHLEGLYKDFIFYPTSIPLGLHPLLPIE
jgi:hypothetical protein